MDGETFSPDEDSGPAGGNDEGSNLVDSRPAVGVQEATLLDLPRVRVDRSLFQSFTSTGTFLRKLLIYSLDLQSTSLLSGSPGISSPLLSFRAFSLSPGSRYMLDVTASKFLSNTFLPWSSVSNLTVFYSESDDRFLGRTQLFVKTEPVPKGVMCQVQPVEGAELHTPFSIFCTSGKAVPPHFNQQVYIVQDT